MSMYFDWTKKGINNNNKSFRGSYDASTNVFPTTNGSGISGAINAGDYWIVTIAGTLGAITVVAGANITALTNLPGQISNNWYINQNAVNSVFNRKGAITAQSNDYSIEQITNGLSNVLPINNIFVGNENNLANKVSVLPEILLPNTTVIAGEYINPNITVDAKGRITNSSSNPLKLDNVGTTPNAQGASLSTDNKLKLQMGNTQFAGVFKAGANLLLGEDGSLGLEQSVAKNANTEFQSVTSKQGYYLNDEQIATKQIKLKAPAILNKNYNLTLPNDLPTSAGQVLAGDTLGNTSWTTPQSQSSFRGSYDASTNVFPTGAINAGDYWIVTTAGTLGGIAVAAGANITALTNLPGQVSNNWYINQNAVNSVFNRKGAITAQSNDYSIEQITNGLSNVLPINNIFVGNENNLANKVSVLPEILLPNTTVIAGEYINPNITVDAKGRITNSSSNPLKLDNVGTTPNAQGASLSTDNKLKLQMGNTQFAGVFKAGANLLLGEDGSLGLEQSVAKNANTEFQSVTSKQGYYLNDEQIATKQIKLKAPAILNKNYNLTLPNDLPTSAGQVLAGDTLGNTSWTTPQSGGSGGTIQAVLNSTLPSGTIVQLLSNGKIDSLVQTYSGDSITLPKINSVFTNGDEDVVVPNMMHTILGDGRILRIYATNKINVELYAQIGNVLDGNVTWNTPQYLNTLFNPIDLMFNLISTNTNNFILTFKYANTTGTVIVYGGKVNIQGVVTLGNVYTLPKNNLFNVYDVKIIDMSINENNYYVYCIVFDPNVIVTNNVYLGAFSLNSSTLEINLIGNSILNSAFGIGEFNQSITGQTLSLSRYTNNRFIVAGIDFGSVNAIRFSVCSFNTTSAPSVLNSNVILSSIYTSIGAIYTNTIIYGSSASANTGTVAITICNGTNTSSTTPVTIASVTMNNSIGFSVSTSPWLPTLPMSMPSELSLIAINTNVFVLFRARNIAYIISAAFNSASSGGNIVTPGNIYNIGNSYNGASTPYNSNNFVCHNKSILNYFNYLHDNDNNNIPTCTQGIIGGSVFYNINNYIGILQTSGDVNTTQTVTVAGGVNTALTGLTTQLTYYFDVNNNILTTMPTEYPIGRALSSTTIQLISPNWILLPANGGENGSVKYVSVETANGFDGTVTLATTTPLIKIGTTVTGIVCGDNKTIRPALITDYPIFNQNTTGTASNITNILPATLLPNTTVIAGEYINPNITVDAKGRITNSSSNPLKLDNVGTTPNAQGASLSTDNKLKLQMGNTQFAGVFKAGANLLLGEDGSLGLEQSVAKNGNPLFQYLVLQNNGLKINDGISKQVTLSCPNSIIQDYRFNLPVNVPIENNYVLVGSPNGNIVNTTWESLANALPKSSTTNFGAIKIGSNIDVTDGVISLEQNLSKTSNPKFNYVVVTDGYYLNDGQIATKQIKLKAPAILNKNYNLTLPNDLPTSAGQVLAGDTLGNTSWTTPQSGNNGGTIQAVLNSTLSAGSLVRLLPTGKIDSLVTSITGNNYNIVSQNPTITNGSVAIGVNNMLHCTMNDGRLVRLFWNASTTSTLSCQIGTANASGVTWSVVQSLTPSGILIKGAIDLIPCGTSGFVCCLWDGDISSNPTIYVQGVVVNPAGIITRGNAGLLLSNNAYQQGKLCDMTLNGVAYFCAFVPFGLNSELSSWTLNETTANISKIGSVNLVFTTGGGGYQGQSLALIRYCNNRLIALMPNPNASTLYGCIYNFNTNSSANIVASSNSFFNWTSTGTIGYLKGVCTKNGGVVNNGIITLVSTTVNTGTTPISIGSISIDTNNNLFLGSYNIFGSFASTITPSELEIVSNQENNWFLTFRASNTAYAMSGVTDGNNCTLASQITLGTSFKTLQAGNTYNSGNLVVYGNGIFNYFQYDVNNYASVTQFFAGNTTSYDISNYIGILQTGGDANTTQTVTVAGGVNTALTSLTSNGMYYFNPLNGSLTLTATMYPIGKAINATNLMLISPIWQNSQIINYMPTTINKTISSANGLTSATVDETGYNAGRFVVKTNGFNTFIIDSTSKPTFLTSTINIAATNTPSFSTSPGTLGDICYDANYMYVCVASNTWKRIPLTSW